MTKRYFKEQKGRRIHESCLLVLKCDIDGGTATKGTGKLESRQAISSNSQLCYDGRFVRLSSEALIPELAC